ncbi:hypothetical protein BKA69DRAFT_322713 [Paraphysoderma sedebokerense]|nr:hypothetical protein BKA69DRAFT_322713 [Paraphysoderma sedebokerense]
MSAWESFKTDLKSGKFTVYAQWMSYLSVLFLIIFGISNLFSTLIIFALIALCEAAVMFLMELPFFAKCCPTGPRMQSCIAFFEGNWLRAALYAAFAFMMWLSLMVAASGLIVSAVTLTICAICYALAGFKHQERENTALTGNIATFV